MAAKRHAEGGLPPVRSDAIPRIARRSMTPAVAVPSSAPAPRAHPPYDPELAHLVGEGAVDGHSLRPGDIPRLRAIGDQWHPSLDDLRWGGAVFPEWRTVPGVAGAGTMGGADAPAADVRVLVLWPTTPYVGPRPTILFCHGGGLVTGDAFSGAPALARWVAELGVVAVSVDYRLAPEHPYPAALDDVMTVLAWLHRERDELGLDPWRLGIYGISAGGGLAAAAALRARDEGLPGPSFQVLQDAMLDDRMVRPSTYEHVGTGAWDRTSSRTAWAAYLGTAPGGSGVSAYAAPARAADDPACLVGLAPTYLDVGSADLFRDDVLAYGTALAQAGVSTEMHLWPGGWHGFSEMAAGSRLGRLANEARTAYVARLIGR